MMMACGTCGRTGIDPATHPCLVRGRDAAERQKQTEELRAIRVLLEGKNMSMNPFEQQLRDCLGFFGPMYAEEIKDKMILRPNSANFLLNDIHAGLESLLKKKLIRASESGTTQRTIYAKEGS